MIVIDEYKSGREAVNKNLCRNRFSGWTMLGACNNERVKKPILRRTVESDAESWTDGVRKQSLKRRRTCSSAQSQRWRGEKRKGLEKRNLGPVNFNPFASNGTRAGMTNRSRVDISLLIRFTSQSLLFHQWWRENKLIRLMEWYLTFVVDIHLLIMVFYTVNIALPDQHEQKNSSRK